MLPSNEDKKMLIESMKKLTNNIANNSARQQEIFNSLSRNDIIKVVTHLWDDNQYLRRVSGLLLCQLLYNSKESKDKMTNILQIFPSNGRVCLNQFPKSFPQYGQTLKKCIQLMKAPISQQQSNKLCWFISLDRKVPQLQFLQYKKYSSFTFLDPARNLFGITIFSQEYIKKVQKQLLNIKSIQKARTPIKNDYYIPISARSSKDSYRINSTRVSTDIQQKIRSKYFHSKNSLKVDKQDLAPAINATMYNLSSPNQRRQRIKAKNQNYFVKEQSVETKSHFNELEAYRNYIQNKYHGQQRKNEAVSNRTIIFNKKINNSQLHNNPKSTSYTSNLKSTETKNITNYDPTLLHSRKSRQNSQTYRRIRQIQN